MRDDLKILPDNVNLIHQVISDRIDTIVEESSQQDLLAFATSYLWDSYNHYVTYDGNGEEYLREDLGEDEIREMVVIAQNKIVDKAIAKLKRNDRNASSLK